VTFTMDGKVAAVLQAALEKTGPPPTPPIGDVQTRRAALDAMLEYFNNQAQPLADDVKITDHDVATADGATPSTRTCRAARKQTAAACCGACNPSGRGVSPVDARKAGSYVRTSRSVSGLMITRAASRRCRVTASSK
jgi:hypothetical protein